MRVDLTLRQRHALLSEPRRHERQVRHLLRSGRLSERRRRLHRGDVQGGRRWYARLFESARRHALPGRTDLRPHQGLLFQSVQRGRRLRGPARVPDGGLQQRQLSVLERFVQSRSIVLPEHGQVPDLLLEQAVQRLGGAALLRGDRHLRSVLPRHRLRGRDDERELHAAGDQRRRHDDLFASRVRDRGVQDGARFVSLERALLRGHRVCVDAAGVQPHAAVSAASEAEQEELGGRVRARGAVLTHCGDGKRRGRERVSFPRGLSALRLRARPGRSLRPGSVCRRRAH